MASRSTHALPPSLFCTSQDWTAFIDTFCDTVHAHGLAAKAPAPTKVRTEGGKAHKGASPPREAGG
jgi:hypothetical protein